MLNEYSIGDSRELLKEVESSSVDLIYIDPPYCTGRDFYHFNDKFKSSQDYRELLIKPIITECHRVLSDVGNIVVVIPRAGYCVDAICMADDTTVLLSVCAYETSSPLTKK